MSLIQIDWKPDRKTLREFSEYWMFFLGMVFAPLAYFRAEQDGGPGWETAAYVFWGLAVVGRLLGGLKPDWLRPLYLGMMFLAMPIGWVISHLALGILYYGLITPLAIAFRLAGRDPLQRKFDREATTYWETRSSQVERQRYFRQF